MPSAQYSIGVYLRTITIAELSEQFLCFDFYGLPLPEGIH